MLGNWIKQTTTSIGAGDIVVAGVTGFPGFHDLFGLLKYFSYTILDDASGYPIETGIGHMSDSSTLVRDRITATYIAGVYNATTPVAAALPAGTKRVICSGDASMFDMTIPAIEDCGGADGRRVAVTPSGTLGTLTLTADRLYQFPLYFPAGLTFDTLYADISTAAAGAHIQFGVAACKPDGSAGALLLTSGEQPASAAAMLAADVGVQRLAPGYYWGLMICDANVGVRSCAMVVEAHAGYQTSTARYRNSHGYVEQTYGALPSAIPAMTTRISNATSGQTPLLWAGGI
ncbi:MAG: hypothetical protein CVU31_02465 [Betaproteobacteria bacterium HGW-Betaproteobacteria-4]|jgi:hypothetical protein|nr:MAG: hypothetical protein CVU31_02465 [Betaproteobacteria bacterium HGW-Betaproteobacteria-4]